MLPVKKQLLSLFVHRSRLLRALGSQNPIDFRDYIAVYGFFLEENIVEHISRREKISVTCKMEKLSENLRKMLSYAGYKKEELVGNIEKYNFFEEALVEFIRSNLSNFAENMMTKNSTCLEFFLRK